MKPRLRGCGRQQDGGRESKLNPELPDGGKIQRDRAFCK